MNYKEELEKMQMQPEKMDIWKPNIGTYDVEFLAEPEESQFTFPDGRSSQQKKFSIKVANQVLTWYVSVGKTPQCVYYQLLKVAILNGEKFIGAKIKMQVSESRKDDKLFKKYFVL